MFMTSAILRRVILGLSGVVFRLTIWNGRQLNIVICLSILRLNGSFITTSRLWNLVILVFLFCLVGGVLIQRLAGLRVVVSIP